MPETIGQVLGRLLHRGVVVEGDVVIALGNVDLVYLNIRLLLASVETVRHGLSPMPVQAAPSRPPAEPPPQEAGA